ncbi:Flp pilus assembly complex ATPase component TadA [bacterium]|nr:Flp pilus assembly complex ATPase component TadA [bacterium]
MNIKKSLIVCVDDDRNIYKLEEMILKSEGYKVICTDKGEKAIALIKDVKPDLVLLDAMMPDMDGYELCSKLQENEKTAYIPVIFVTVLDEKQDKAKAFSAGAVDYIVKPIQKEVLLSKVSSHLKTNFKWKEIKNNTLAGDVNIMPSDFIRFKDYLSEKLNLSYEAKERLSTVAASNIYSITEHLGIQNNQMARYISDFLNRPYLAYINPDDIQLGVIPAAFSRKNFVLAITDVLGRSAYVLSNPFNWELIEVLKRYSGTYKRIVIAVTEPENIDFLFRNNMFSIGKGRIKRENLSVSKYKIGSDGSKAEVKDHPVISIANNIIESAITERASDIHIEPKETNVVVRFRIDGDMREYFILEKVTGIMVISRIKAISGLDITEKRKPQDGILEALINNKVFRLRLATTATSEGESLIIRLVEPRTKPKLLQELGMTNKQADTMIELANRIEGFILMVGPTGSGKTTTIYSLLSNLDCQTRSLISIEDPIEYRIPFANQQQVNEKAGVTFDALLKSSVRQDPDILYIGEIRDQYSANIAMDFASTGHLTISTLHTSNATTAIFRLERLGISRGSMADSLLCVVGQRLLKKLCPHCRKIDDISQKEKDILSPYTDDIPLQVAHPVGCPKCNDTGYYDREGIYEVIKFDPDISEMIRLGVPISEIRDYIAKKGYYLISRHAVEKVKEFICSPRDVFEKVLVEEEKLGDRTGEKRRFMSVSDKKMIECTELLEKGSAQENCRIPEREKKMMGNRNIHGNILLVDDDKNIQKVVSHILKNGAYDVTVAGDGIEALMNLGKNRYDLIISDIRMPNLDGFKLMEMIYQKGINIPVIFLTGVDEQDKEVRGFELGAVDFIRKPVKKEVLLLRVRKVIERSAAGEADLQSEDAKIYARQAEE